MKIAGQNEAVNRRWCLLGIQAMLLIVGCLVFYGPIFPSLIKEWYEHENFSYGFLIPLIFLYLIWEERNALINNTVRIHSWGVVSFSAAVLLGFTGKVLGEPFIYRVSFVFVVASFVHMFWGGRCVKRLAFPLAFLLLMVPPPYIIVKEVSYYLRMFDAFIANYLVQAVGVPVYRDAYLLHLPEITLEVADVCSGIASLFAMLALGTIYVYYLPTRISMKLVVLLGAFLFPMLANLFRIFLVTVSVYYYGPIMLQAFFHHFTGTFTFLLSLVMVLWLGETIRRKYPKTAASNAHQASQSAFASLDETLASRSGYQTLTLPVSGMIILLVFLFGLLNFPAFSRGEGNQVQLEKLSSTIGTYHLIGGNYADPYADARAEKSLSRVYETPEKNHIELFVAYNSRQFDENRLQSPKLVFPRGWEYASMEQIDIGGLGTEPIHAVGLLTKKSIQKRFVLFWYQVRGRSFASDLRNRIELMKGLALRGRTDGAVVRLATEVGDLESVENAKNRLIAFSAKLYPNLLKILPD